MTHYKTESVDFLGLMNSATKDKSSREKSLGSGFRVYSRVLGRAFGNLLIPLMVPTSSRVLGFRV